MHKMLCATLVLLLSAALLFAGDAKKYGKDLTVKEVTKVSDILATPEKYKGKRVKVEGKVSAVCQMRGCWIMIEGEKPSETIRFKVDDGVIEFPKDAKGKMAVAEGVISVSTLSEKDQIAQGEHMAQEGGMTFDPKTVKGPKVVPMIKGEGAELR